MSELKYAIKELIKKLDDESEEENKEADELLDTDSTDSYYLQGAADTKSNVAQQLADLLEKYG